MERILERVEMPVQLGGGIRDLATVEGWLEKASTRIIIGTAAVRDPAFVRDAAQALSRPRRGRHRRAGRHVAVRGLGQERRSFRRLSSAGASRTPASPPSSIPTSPATALLKGLNIEATLALAGALDIPVIASGGLASIDDIERLLEPDCTKLDGAIAGPRAL